MSLPRHMIWALPILEWHHMFEARMTGSNTQRGMAALCRLRRTTGLYVSTHALDRFVERWRPYADREEARATLTEMLCAAQPVGQEVGWCRSDEAHTPSEPWMAGPIRLIVRAKTVVTILPMEAL